MHKPKGDNLKFTMIYDCLHIHVLEKSNKMFVNTVAANKKGYSKRQLKAAARARALYVKLMYPSLKDFKWALMSNQIKDCPVTVKCINVAQSVWGKDISALKGKTVRKKSTPVRRSEMKVPRDSLKLHKDVTVAIDIFFVTDIPFFLTPSHKINFMSATNLENRKIGTIAKAFCEVYN
jgi:hypothetical protein